MNDSLKKHIDKNREEFENKMPSDKLWAKIKTQVPIESEVEDSTLTKENEQPKEQKSWSIGYWAIAASVLIVFGISFFFFNQSEVETTKTVAKSSQKKVEIKQQNTVDDTIGEELNNQSTTIKEYSSKNELAQLKANDKEKNTSKKAISEPIKNNNEALLAQLQDEFSTSNRIDALAKYAQQDGISNHELDVIKNIALSDPNTVVRLNSIEVLARQLPKESMNQEMKEIFMSQDDPMVQMELINVLAKVNNHSLDVELTQKLQQMVLDPQTKPFVKDEAYAVLLKK